MEKFKIEFGFSMSIKSCRYRKGDSLDFINIGKAIARELKSNILILLVFLLKMFF